MKWHWLRHDWEKWQAPYSQEYTCTGELYQILQKERLRQRRFCRTCRKMQDEVVSELYDE